MTRAQIADDVVEDRLPMLEAQAIRLAALRLAWDERLPKIEE